MAVMTAEILTGWTAQAGRRFADVYLRYPLSACHDVTGQPAESIIPAVNLFAVQVECRAEVLAEIEGDAELFVVWSEEA
jgi:hypothetical protein